MDDVTSDERWSPIPGFSGYLVSDQGRVWSLERWVAGRPDCRPHYRAGRALRCFPARDGYPQVRIVRDDGKHVSVKVHLLVLTTFVGEKPSDDAQARHANDDHTDVRLSNLSWGSRGENMLDRRRNRGHGSGKTHLELCEARRQALRDRLSDGSRY